jgi:hypothetical protein
MKTYAIHVRMKPIQIVEASNRADAIEIIRKKFVNAFITKVEKTQKKALWCDRIVLVTPNNTKYKPFTVTYFEYCDENALQVARDNGYDKIGTIEIFNSVTNVI